MKFTFISYSIDTTKTNTSPARCLRCKKKIGYREGNGARRRTQPYRHGYLCLTCLYQYVDESQFFFGQGLPFEGVKERRIEIQPLYTKEQIKEFLMSKSPAQRET